MNYEKACQSDILECIKLKNNVISHLKSIGLNIWDKDYPSDELIKNDILFSNARVIKNKGEIIAYLCFYDPNIEYNEYPFKEEKLYPDLITYFNNLKRNNYIDKNIKFNQFYFFMLVMQELNICVFDEGKMIINNIKSSLDNSSIYNFMSKLLKINR